MGAALGQGRLAELDRVGLRQRLGHVIVGSHCIWPAVAESFQEVPHRTGGQAEGGRQTGRGFPLLGTLEQFLPHRDGHGFGHRNALLARRAERFGIYSLDHANPIAAKPRDRSRAAKPTGQ